MVVSCCNHVSHVRSSASSSLTLSRVPLFWWVLVPHTVIPFLLYHASLFSLHKYPKHLSPLLGILWLWVWCFLCTPAKTHSTTADKVEDATADAVQSWFETASNLAPKDLSERIDSAPQLLLRSLLHLITTMHQRSSRTRTLLNTSSTA